MLLTDSPSVEAESQNSFEEEKANLLKDLDDKKISQQEYDKKIQEIDQKISAQKNKTSKIEATPVKSTTDLSDGKKSEEEKSTEEMTEVVPIETEDKTLPPPKVKEAKITTSEKKISANEKKERNSQRTMPEQDKIKAESKTESFSIYDQKEDFEEVIAQKIQELSTIQSGNQIKINQPKFDSEELISDKTDINIPEQIPPVLGQRNVTPHKNEISARSLNSVGDSGLISQLAKVTDVTWRTLSY